MENSDSSKPNRSSSLSEELQLKLCILEERIEINDEKLTNTDLNMNILNAQFRIVVDWMQNLFGLELINKNSSLYQHLNHEPALIQSMVQSLSNPEEQDKKAKMAYEKINNASASTSLSPIDKEAPERSLSEKQINSVKDTSASPNLRNVLTNEVINNQDENKGTNNIRKRLRNKKPSTTTVIVESSDESDQEEEKEVVSSLKDPLEDSEDDVDLIVGGRGQVDPEYLPTDDGAEEEEEADDAIDGEWSDEIPKP